MGREAQSPYSRLSPRLEADLHRMNFYRLCQLLEKRNPGRPLMGSTSHPGDDPVRFAPHPGMGFPASEMKAVEYDEEDDSRPPLIRTTFMGMYGVDSPLPTAYLDDIAQRREGHYALQGFLDIFSHRILTQFTVSGVNTLTLPPLNPVVQTASRSHCWAWWGWVFPAQQTTLPHRYPVFWLCWVSYSNRAKRRRGCRRW